MGMGHSWLKWVGHSWLKWVGQLWQIELFLGGMLKNAGLSKTATYLQGISTNLKLANGLVPSRLLPFRLLPFRLLKVKLCHFAYSAKIVNSRLLEQP